MLFHSLEFAVLVSLIWPVYLLLRRHDRQNVLLLAASYVFYGWWDWRFLPLLLVSTSIDYAAGRALGRTAAPGLRRAILLVSCGSNLGLLGFFKYWNFFASSSNGLAAWLGMEAVLPELHVLLPIGISFYTFQSMAYAIDVYRGRFPAWRSFVEFATYVAFFPQLVAGPIERPDNLLRAIAAPRRVTWEGLEEGAFLFAKGWLVKAIADALAPIADRVFADPGAQAGWMPLWGIYAFVFQLYGDFLGYSEMARGVARAFGFRLVVNFRAPFFASDVRQLWARWHMSLTSWIREYVFHPLGGSRRGRARTGLNLFLTYTLLGVWHGAGWNYVMWGMLFGLVMAGHQFAIAPGSAARERWLSARPALRGAWHAVSVLVTFHAFTLSAVLFRAEANQHASVLGNAWAHTRALAGLPWRDFEPPPAALWVIAILVLLDVAELRQRHEHGWVEHWPWALRGVAIGALCAAAIVLSSEIPMNFVYFQF